MKLKLKQIIKKIKEIKDIKFLIITFILSIFVVSFVDHAHKITFTTYETPEIVGFGHGLFHGIISFPALIISLFEVNNVAIYAIYNNGFWYDFGFLLGISAFLMSISRSK